MEKLEKECAEILKCLMCKHDFINPESNNFDIWDKNDSQEFLADLIKMIRYSEHIETAIQKHEWGK